MAIRLAREAVPRGDPARELLHHAHARAAVVVNLRADAIENRRWEGAGTGEEIVYLAGPHYL